MGLDRELRAVRLVPVLEQADEPALESGDVVLVTGGAKGITAECIRHLAAQQTLTIVILARTELSGRSEQFMEFGLSNGNKKNRRSWRDSNARVMPPRL